MKVTTGTNLVLRVTVSGAVPPLSYMASFCAEGLSCSVIGNNNVVVSRIYNNNIFIYLLQLGCYPVAVVILHVNNT